MAGLKVRKGDTVQVISGKDRGFKGKVIETDPGRERVLVEGVNRIRKHTKVTSTTRGAKTGGIVTQEAPVHVSNVMVVCPECDRATRIERRQVSNEETGKTIPVRICKKCGKEIMVGDGMTATTTEAPAAPARTAPRLKQRYRDEISAQLREQFGYSNVMQIPGLTKVVVNMGVGEAARDAKLIDGAVRDLTTITGQKPQVTRSRKSIAQFKLRENMAIGCHVTLRGDRMWEFLDRLLALALPRIRDFRGLSPRQFDGHGNYTFGLTEQVMFHEIDQDRIDRFRGMDITVVTTANTDDEGRALLRLLGFPFREN